MPSGNEKEYQEAVDAINAAKHRGRRFCGVPITTPQHVLDTLVQQRYTLNYCSEDSLIIIYW